MPESDGHTLDHLDNTTCRIENDGDRCLLKLQCVKSRTQASFKTWDNWANDRNNVCAKRLADKVQAFR